jgi:hypothetical protein
MTPRFRYLVLAAITIASGLALQQSRSRLSFAFADVLGDALWGLMIFWLVAAAQPTRRILLRASIALAVCWLVELSQLYHTVWLDAVRATTIGHLTLGSDFDVRDLLAYALGTLVGLRTEIILSRHGTRADRRLR